MINSTTLATFGDGGRGGRRGGKGRSDVFGFGGGSGSDGSKAGSIISSFGASAGGGAGSVGVRRTTLPVPEGSRHPQQQMQTVGSVAAPHVDASKVSVTGCVRSYL